MAEAVDRFGLVGTLVADKYFIERVVGEGGFGVVYRAVHRIWDEPVALKCFTALSNAPVDMRDELLEQFVREGKLLTALSSRTTGIVQARDIGTLTTPNGVWLPYMVLEWLDGRPLEAWIGQDRGVPRSAQRSILETFQLMDGPARALALAHNRGVAHRDLKPANFFVLGELGPGVVIKVLDFGIAKVMQSQARTAMQATGAQISSFTPSYGAPEQFDRTYGATGPWTDVYQMALIMVEIMRGGLPALEGEMLIQLAFSTQNPERRPTPRTLGLPVSDAVEAVFRKAVALKVVDRYANMAEFWTALAAALELRDYPPLAANETGTGSIAALDLAAPGRTQRPPDLPTANVGHTLTTPQSTRTVPGAPRTVVPLEGKLARAPRPVWQSPALLGGLSVVVGAAVVFGLMRKEPEPTPPPVAETKTPAPEPETKKTAEPVVAAKPEPCPAGMQLITGKNFYMGTDSKVPVLALARPAHKVTIRPYCLDMYEVTTEAYEKCSDAGDCKRAYRDSWWPQGGAKKPDWEKARAAYTPLCNAEKGERKKHPINCVTWSQADEFCRVHGKRLPTEAEFEYAARGSDGRVYPWGDAKPSAEHLNACGSECVAWRKAAGLPPVEPMYAADDGFAGTSPVGSFSQGRTEAGLYDMTGNVFEWTADRFLPYPSSEGAAPPAATGNSRVIRGGAFNSFEPEHTDPALRLPYDADAHTHGIGFRCAADPR